MKKDKHGHKAHQQHHQEQSRKNKLQLQFKQVRRRRTVTAGFGLLVLVSLLVGEYYSSVPAWLYVVFWVIPFLLVMDTAYLKYLRRQLANP